MLGHGGSIGAMTMTSKTILDWVSKLAFSGGVTLTATYLAALMLTYKAF